jgi:hypothetical protein
MKNMLPLMIFAFMVAAGGYCVAAQTNDHKAVFHAADTNRSGRITLDEFKRHAKQEFFRNIDRDNDKKIDRREWQAAFPAPRTDDHFESADADRDAALSFLEFSRKIDERYDYGEVFNALDRNRDGSLAPDEFNARPAFNILSIRF